MLDLLSLQETQKQVVPMNHALDKVVDILDWPEL